MTAKQSIEFPRVNFVALMSGVLLLVSIFLYWWGIDSSGSFFGVSTSQPLRWSLWSGPASTTISSAQSFQTLVTYSTYVGVLAVVAAVLVLLGTFPNAHRLLYMGVIASILCPVVYAIVVNYAVANACNGSSNCISGPFGTQTMSVGSLSMTTTWGFQPGFYIAIAGAVLAVIAIAFNRTFLTTRSP